MSILNPDGLPVAPSFKAEMVRHDLAPHITLDPNPTVHPEHPGVMVVRFFAPGRVIYVNADLLDTLPVTWIMEMAQR